MSGREDPRIQPFELGTGSRHVLLIHGFTGTPFEMRPLGERLAAAGYRCHGVRLPGHGLEPEELERTNAMDWVNGAREVLFQIPDDEPVYIAGLSMGSLIGAILAADHPQRVRGLVLLAPPVSLRPLKALMVELARIGPLTSRYRFHPRRRSPLIDQEMLAQNPCIPRIPTVSAAQFAHVQGLGRIALPRVTAPSMVIYSLGDATVRPEGARQAAKLIGRQPVRVLELERSCHVVTLDVDRERVAQEIQQFFDSLGAAGEGRV